MALLAIGLVGALVTAYLVNLRLDVLLYARTVNGIRGYFTEGSGLKRTAVVKHVVLPSSTAAPAYWEPLYFLPVVISCGVLNSIYVAGGCYLLSSCWWTSSVLAILSMALQVVSYRLLASYREHFYLKMN